jgi:hypothetical protein
MSCLFDASDFRNIRNTKYRPMIKLLAGPQIDVKARFPQVKKNDMKS